MACAIHHVGLSVVDMDRARRFHEDAFGFAGRSDVQWTAEALAGLDGVGAVRRTGFVQAPNLLVALVEADRPPRPLPRPVNARGITHICVQATRMAPLARSATDAGAAFHAPPTDLGGDILYAYPRDPEGNVVELESVPQAHDEPDAWVAHVSLTTGDIDRLSSFYKALSGNSVRRSPRLGPNPKIDRLTGLADVVVTGAWISLANAQLEFWQYHHPTTVPDAPGIGYTHVAFEIGDAAEVDAIADRTGTSFVEIRLVESARCFAARDPDGNRIALVAPDDGARTSISTLADPGIVARVETARQGAVA